jgi:hypothetical protein
MADTLARVPKRPRDPAPDTDPLLDVVTGWLAADPDMAGMFAHLRRTRGVLSYHGTLGRAVPVSLLQCRHTLALLAAQPLAWPHLPRSVQLSLLTILCLLCEAPDAPTAGWSALGAAAMTPKPFGVRV